ncbi:MAG: DUF2894 domain-containing protein [Rhodocyclaceae bacterium]|nr:DUF2894 domain-containing protein [Rhodocyclaceae bacterium]MBX3666841.1 DUF2894 domain-containing protein [Rhodocyclaceae bacterium]
MDEAAAGTGREAALPQPGGPGDAAAAIAALRDAHADRLDPVRFRFIEALASRALAHGGAVRRHLDDRLAQALDDYRTRYPQAQSTRRVSAQRAANGVADVGGPQQVPDAGAESGMPRADAAGADKANGRTALAELLSQLARPSPDAAEARMQGDAECQPGVPPELKTVAQFRSVWSKLAADRQVAQSLEQAPDNAGPINSHSLVLRSLERMRYIAPDYLGRFMSYVDTLLWLEQADTKPSTSKSRARPKRQK